MKKLSLLILLLISYTQNYGQNNSNNETNVFQIYKYSILNQLSDPSWLGGSIYLNDSTVIDGYVYKYNVITDEIEVKANINPANVEYISIGMEIFMYSKFIKDEAEYAGYFEVLVRGDCMLLLRRDLERTTETTSDVALGIDKQTKVKESLYIKKDKQPAVRIKNKKNISEYLTDKKGFAEYIENKSFLFLNEKKAREIVEYYNQL